MRAGWLGAAVVLGAMGCGGTDHLFDKVPAIVINGAKHEGTPPARCDPPQEQPAVCREAAVVASPSGTWEAAGAKPEGWRAPGVLPPFGYFEAPACVDAPALPDPRTACAVEVYDGDELTSIQELAGEDQLAAFILPTGERVYEAHRDERGRVVLERWTYLDGQFNEIGWSFRGDGSLTDFRRAFGMPLPDGTLLRSPTFERACDGRTRASLRGCAGQDSELYEYDSAGRLVEVRSADAYDRFFHDASGRLREHLRGGSWFGPQRKVWDAGGKLVAQSHSGEMSSVAETYEHGPHGLVRQYSAGDRPTRNGASFEVYSALTEKAYDDAGRRTLRWSVTEARDGAQTRLEAVASRVTYSCRGGPVLEEIDQDGDGLADARREWSAGPAGTVEEYEGPLGRKGAWKRYRFDCATAR